MIMPQALRRTGRDPHPPPRRARNNAARTREFRRQEPANGQDQESTSFSQAVEGLKRENRRKLGREYLSENPGLIDDRGPMRFGAPEGAISMLMDRRLQHLAAFARSRVSLKTVKDHARILKEGNGERQEAAMNLAMIFADPVYDQDVRRQALRELINDLPRGNDYSKGVFTALGLSAERIAEIGENAARASRSRVLHPIEVPRRRRKVEGFIDEMMGSMHEMETEAERDLRGVEATPKAETQEKARLILNDAALAEIAKTHEDQAIRMAAVEGIENVAVLVDVAREAEDAEVRKKALKKTGEDKGALISIAQLSRYDDTALAALDMLGNDLDTLMKVIQGINRAAKNAALEGITNHLDDLDDEGLEQVARKGHPVAMAALERMTSSDNIANVASFADNEAVRLTAFERIKYNFEALTSVAIWGSGKETKKLAAEELAKRMDELEEKELEQVAQSTEDEQVALAALERMKDPKNIENIACFAANEAVKMAAFERIKDNVEALTEIAEWGSGQETRKLAVGELAKRIDDLHDKGLGLVAQKAEDKQVALEALERINDIGVIEEMADGLSDNQQLLIGHLARRLNELSEKGLELVARHTHEEQLAMAALERMTSSDNIANVACWAGNEGVRMAAFERIKDDAEALTSVSRWSCHDDTKRPALKILAAAA